MQLPSLPDSLCWWASGQLLKCQTCSKQQQFLDGRHDSMGSRTMLRWCGGCIVFLCSASWYLEYQTACCNHALCSIVSMAQKLVQCHCCLFWRETRGQFSCSERNDQRKNTVGRMINIDMAACDWQTASLYIYIYVHNILIYIYIYMYIYIYIYIIMYTCIYIYIYCISINWGVC